MKISSVGAVARDSQLVLRRTSKTNECRVTTEGAHLASDIRYGDRRDNVTGPDLIDNERTNKVRTLTRLHVNAGCRCGSWIAGIDQEWAYNDGRRHRQSSNDASCSVNVEHGSVIYRRGMAGSLRLKLLGHVANWRRQCKVADLSCRASHTGGRKKSG